jgi:hypothetical protein
MRTFLPRPGGWGDLVARRRPAPWAGAPGAVPGLGRRAAAVRGFGLGGGFVGKGEAAKIELFAKPPVEGFHGTSRRAAHAGTFTSYGAEAKARDFYGLKSAAAPAARANLKQMAQLYLKEAVALLSERPSTHPNSVTTDCSTFDMSSAPTREN